MNERVAQVVAFDPHDFIEGGKEMDSAGREKLFT